MRVLTSMLLLVTLVTVDASAAVPDEDAPVVGYEKGLRIGREQDRASVTLGGRAQGRYTSTTQRDEPAETEWAAQRLRLSAKGHLATPRLRYYGQLAFEEGFELRDALVDVTVVPDRLRVRAGKWKMPGARHHLNSSGRLALVDRSITHKAFDASRGIGVMLHNDVEGKQRFGWAFGSFLDDTNRLRFDQRANETPVDRPYEPALAGRVALNFGATKINDEVYWDGGSARAGFGAFAIDSLDTNGDGDGRLRTGIDWIAVYGPLSVTGDVQVAVQHSLDGADYDGVGFHQQVAALLFGHFVPALRFAVVDPVGEAVQTELAAGASLMFTHRLKLGADLAALRNATEPDEVRARVQAQIVF